MRKVNPGGAKSNHTGRTEGHESIDGQKNRQKNFYPDQRTEDKGDEGIDPAKYYDEDKQSNPHQGDLGQPYWAVRTSCKSHEKGDGDGHSDDKDAPGVMG